MARSGDPRPLHLRLLLDVLDEPAILLQPDGVVLDANAAMARRLGIARGRLAGRRLADLISPSGGDGARLLRRALDGGRTVTAAVVLERPDGTQIPCRASARCVRPPAEGAPAILCLRCREPAARPSPPPGRSPRFDALVARERQLRRLNWALTAYAASTAALVRFDSTESLMSRVCESIAGQDPYILASVGVPEDAPGKPVRWLAWAGSASGYADGLYVSWSADVPEGLGPTGRAIRSGMAHIMQDARLDPIYADWRKRGERFGIRSSVTVPFKTDGKVVGALLVYASRPDAFGSREMELFQQLADELGFAMKMDADRARLKASEDARRQAELAVRRERDFSEAMIRSLPGVLYMYDENGVFLRWNSNFERVTGRTGEEIARMHPTDFFQGPEQQRIRTAIGDVFKYGEATIEADFAAADGRLSPYFFTGVKVQIEGRTCLVGIGIDITDRKTAEDAARAVQADLARVVRISALGELTTSIAHEINQPLAAIVTNSDASLRWLSHDPANIEEARLAIERTIRDANRANDVIKRIRAVMVKDGASYSALSMNDIVGEILALTLDQRKAASVIVRTELEDGLPLVRGDRVQLQQVLLNLIQNGVDAMKAVEGWPRLLAVRTRRLQDGQVLTEVRDSGVGLAAGAADRLFDRFFTTKEGGTGLGLSISRSIVEAHGGSLWAAPATPHGAIFSFTLPASDG